MPGRRGRDGEIEAIPALEHRIDDDVVATVGEGGDRTERRIGECGECGPVARCIHVDEREQAIDVDVGRGRAEAC